MKRINSQHHRQEMKLVNLDSHTMRTLPGTDVKEGQLQPSPSVDASIINDIIDPHYEISSQCSTQKGKK